MALTDSALKALKPRATAYKVTDEKGLYVQVTPASGKLWKLKFRNKVGAEKKLSLGAYPEISLKEARELPRAAFGCGRRNRRAGLRRGSLSRAA